MRVALAMWPAPAHLYPFAPLAWALRAAGHEVYVVSHPGFGDVVSAEGLPFATVCGPEAPTPMGPGGAWPAERAEVARVTEAFDLPADEMVTWNTFAQFFLVSMWDFTPYGGGAGEPLPVVDGMVAFFRSWQPDLVVWDHCFPAAAVAARAVGARHARLTGPDIVGWSIDAFERLVSGPDARDLPHPMVETLRGAGDRYGVPIDRETLFGQWTINPMPPALNLPGYDRQRTVPMRWLPHTRQEPTPDWLYPVPDRPRIAVSLGISSRSFLGGDWSHVATVLEALGGLDVEVVATLNDVQLADVTTVPDNVRVVEYVPLNQLGPTCSAMIHHGGLASMAAAAALRLPQIVVDFLDRPVIAEPDADGRIGATRYALAPLTGRYITDMGAGEIMDLGKFDVDAVRDQVGRVLTEPSYRAGADDLLADQTAAPTPRDVVPVLERLTLDR